MTSRALDSFRRASVGLLALAALCAPSAGDARLVVMHGYADASSALVWIQSDAPGPIRVTWRPEATAIDRTLTLAAAPANENVVVARLDGLAPGGRATYRVEGDGDRREGVVRAQPPIGDPAEAPPIRIAIGSCYFLSDDDAVSPRDRTYGRGYEIFDAIADKSPDVMLWLGDNVYLRRQDYGDARAMARRYRAQRAHPPLARLLTATSHLAIWDDHDFGPNNADGSFPLKDATLRLFRLYWANPSFGLPGTPGIFGRATFGDVDLFLLDGRYARSNPRQPDGPGKTMFGAAQLAWLKGALRNASGSVKLVANGSQFWNAASRFEGLYQFPSEQRALADFLLDKRIGGLLFVSGDRHFSELLRFDRPGAYPLHEFTSSPLTSRPWEAPDDRERSNPQVVPGTLVGQRQFGLITITGPGDDRRIALESYDTQGKRLWRHELRVRDLAFPPETPAR